MCNRCRSDPVCSRTVQSSAIGSSLFSEQAYPSVRTAARALVDGAIGIAEKVAVVGAALAVLRVGGSGSTLLDRAHEGSRVVIVACHEYVAPGIEVRLGSSGCRDEAYWFCSEQRWPRKQVE